MKAPNRRSPSFRDRRALLAILFVRDPRASIVTRIFITGTDDHLLRTVESQLGLHESATAAIVLDALGALAERLDRPLRVMVIGQTDRRGTDSYNARLRQRRAAAVIERLTELGINPDWLLPARAEWVSPEDAGGQFRRAVFRVLD